jgi:hypothetical protein
VTVIAQPQRLGWAANANALLDRVETEFFFLYFHDDVIEPTYVETLLAALRGRADAQSAHCDLERFGALDGIVPACRYDGPDTRRWITLLSGPRTGTPLRSLTRSSMLKSGLRFLEAGQAGPWQAWPFVMGLIASGPALAVPEVLYRRWYREGSLTRSWGAAALDPVIDGQQRQAARGLELIARADAARWERQLLRYCLYLWIMDFTRRQELRLGHADLIPPSLISSEFPIRAPEGAIGRLDPDLFRRVMASRSQLRFLEGRHAMEQGDLTAARRQLRSALEFDPEHPRAASLLDRVEEAIDADAAPGNGSPVPGDPMDPMAGPGMGR